MMFVRHKPLAIAVLCIVMLSKVSIVFGVENGEAKYIGGTIATIPEKAEGPINLKSEDKLVFMPKKGSVLEIPWGAITDVEYGQKAGRRLKTAIFVSPIALFTKSRKHFITVSYKDINAKDQAVVLEFDKNNIRQVITVFKARSGKEITFQDEEAKKQMGGGI